MASSQNQKKGKMLTCVHCRVVKQSFSSRGRPCPGPGAPAIQPQVDFWRKIKDSEVGSQLLKIWKINKREANRFFDNKGPKRWRRDLTSEGIEPNPGPVNSLTLWSVNCQSANGAWNVLRFAVQHKDALVITLQEVRMTPREFNSFCCIAAKKRGFKCFGGVPGVPHKEPGMRSSVSRGGVCWLVDFRFSFRKGWFEGPNNSQVCSVIVEGIMFLIFMLLLVMEILNLMRLRVWPKCLFETPCARASISGLLLVTPMKSLVAL